MQLAKASVIDAANASRAIFIVFNVFPSNREGIIAQPYEESIVTYVKSRLSF